MDIAELRYLANYKTKTNISILEPSAGQGAIVRAINRILPSQEVDCYELMPLNRSYLKKIPTVNLIGEDFLSTRITQKYDVIIANPPFSKNQDITHVRKMYEHLKPNGVLVAIMSTHWQHTNNKVEREFRAWLDSLSAEVQTVASGEFKESGTMVQSVIVSFRKKASTQEVKVSKDSPPAEKVYEDPEVILDRIIKRSEEALNLFKSLNETVTDGNEKQIVKKETYKQKMEREALAFIEDAKKQYQYILKIPKSQVIEDVLKANPSIRKKITYEQALPILDFQMKSAIDLLELVLKPSQQRPKQKLFVSKLIGLQIRLLTFEYE